MSTLCPRKGAELVFAAMLASLAAACAPPAPPEDSEVVATYRGGTVRADEIERERARLAPDALDAVEADADGAGGSRVALAQRVALRESAAARPAPEPTLEAALASVEEAVLRDARAEALGWSAITVGEEELRRRYEERRDEYRDPEKLRLQDIFLRSEAAEEAAEQRREVAGRLERLRRDVLAGADFAALARAHSDSATANGGGWMVLKAGDQVFPSFAEAAWALEPGEVSEVIDTPNGFHLVRLAARIPPLDRPFEDVREFVRQQAVREERARLEARYLEEVGGDLGLERRYDRLVDPMIAPDEPLLRLGERVYTFQRLTQDLPEPYQSHLYNRSFAKPREMLDSVALGWVLAADARRLGLAERPEVARRIEEALREARFESFVEQRIGERVEALPREELREYFEANRQRYQTLATTTLRVLLLDFEEGELPWDALKRAEGLVERIRAGEDFGELARRHSVHYSARDGGLLEDLTDYGVGRLVQTRARNRKIIADLEPGEVSEPFVAEIYDPTRLRFERTGVYIVRLESRRPPVQAQFEEVEAMVRANYARRFYRQLRDEVEAELLADIEFRMR